MKPNIRTAISLSLVAAFYVLMSFFSEDIAMKIMPSLGNLAFSGHIAYVLIAALAIVIAPFSSVPLIPLGVELWGVVPAALLSAAGWTMGSVFALLLARSFGAEFIKKLMAVDHLVQAEKYVPKNGMFLSVALLHVILPPELVSYAIGLFSRMHVVSYALATAIGVLPFAFFYAYLGTFEWYVQLATMVIVFSILLIIWSLKKKRSR